METDRKYLVCDGVCLLLQQLAAVVERAEAALPLEKLFGGMLTGLYGRKELASFAKCVRDGSCLDAIHVIDGDVRMEVCKLVV